MPHPNPKEIFERDFQVGRLIELYWEYARPYPKDKFFLIAAIKPAPICFVVNSAINRFIQARPALLRCQVTLRKVNYSFLDWDSHLNCTEAITSFKRSVIEEQVLANPKRLKSLITSATRAEVIKAIQDSEDISETHKKYIFKELRPSELKAISD